MAQVVMAVAAVISAAASAYSAHDTHVQARKAREQQVRAMDQAKDDAAAARKLAEREAADRAKALQIEKDKLKAEEARLAAEEAKTKTLIGASASRLKAGRAALLSTGSSVWNSTPATKARTLLGGGGSARSGLKTLLGQ